MSNQTQFFSCFSINLHRFFRASGLRYMNKEVHNKGIDVLNTKTGEFQSFSTLGRAADATGIPYADLVAIHQDLLDLVARNPEIKSTIGRDEFALTYRERTFWVYLRDEKFEKALKAWEVSGPNKR